MSYFLILSIGIAAMAGIFSAIWVLQWKIDNSGVVDIFWGPAVAVVGVFFCVTVDGLPARRWLAGALVSLWALRLSWHLWSRFKSNHEDQRYTQLKETWGESAQYRMFRFYQMQSLGAFVFSLAMFMASKNETPLGVSDLLGIGVWLIAIVGESMSDYQLHGFKQDPNNAGEVCKTGWWKYSRHPNYFFEWLHWCTYVFIAFATSFWWLTLLMPIAMYLFLTKVTGIPLAEKQSVKSRGDKYRRYQETTNAFFPWFPTAD